MLMNSFEHKYISHSPCVNWVEQGNDRYVVFLAENRSVRYAMLNSAAFALFLSLNGDNSYAEVVRRHDGNGNYLNTLIDLGFLKLTTDINSQRDYSHFYDLDSERIISIIEMKQVIPRSGELHLDKRLVKKIFGNLTFMYRPFFPERVDVDLTYSCNLNCSYCYVGKHREQYVVNDNINLYRIIDKVSDANVRQVSFLGGEPFVVPNLVELVKYANNKNIRIIINTNGTLLEKLEQLRGMNVELVVSLDGDHDGSHSYGRTDNHFESVISFIHNAVAANLDITVAHTLTKKNWFKLFGFYLTVKRLGIKRVFPRPFLSIGEGEKRLKESGFGHPYLLFSMLQIKLIRLVNVFCKKKVDFRLPIHFFCNARLYFNVGPTGDIRFCNTIAKDQVISSLNNTTVVEAWNSKLFSRVHDVSRIGYPCNICLLRSNCYRDCRADALGKTGDFYAGRLDCFYGRFFALFRRRK